MNPLNFQLEMTKYYRSLELNLLKVDSRINNVAVGEFSNFLIDCLQE